MQRGRTAIGICLAVVAGLLTSQAQDLKDKLREATGAATTLSSEAEVARDIALRALDNALAARHDVEAGLVAAMKSGNSREMRAAREKAAIEDEATKEAMDLAATVIENAGTSIAACEAARNDAKKSLEAQAPRDVEEGVNRVKRVLDEAGKSYQKAGSALDLLKKKWLIPTNLLPPPPPEPPPPPPKRWWKFGR